MTHPQVTTNAADPQAVLCDQLRAAVDKAATRDAAAMNALHDAVARFTSALRDVGSSPEAVLVSLKTVVNNRSLTDSSPHASDWSGNRLREQISSWCIQEFFRQKTA